MSYAVNSAESVEMEAGYSVRDEVAALVDSPFYAHLFHVVVSLAAAEFFAQGKWEVAAEGLGHRGELCEFRKRFQTGDDGDGYSGLACLLHESVELLVVVEQLGECHLGASSFFVQQDADVTLQIGRFLMLLGVGGNAELKGGALDFHRGAVGKESIVEAVYLVYQFYGVGVAAWCGLIHRLLFRFVASQDEDVADAEELQVKERIFDILFCGARANDMWNHGNAPSLLNGGSDSDSSRSAANAAALYESSLQFPIDIFCPVGGDVDVARTELRQHLNGLE